jgi:hypothetical protein
MLLAVVRAREYAPNVAAPPIRAPKKFARNPMPRSSAVAVPSAELAVRILRASEPDSDVPLALAFSSAYAVGM